MAGLGIAAATLPALVENDREATARWRGAVRLSGDAAAVAGVRLEGADSGWFDAAWEPGAAGAALTLAGVLDHEAAAALSFSLVFLDARGGVLLDSGALALVVLDRDDTPPANLRFAAGGAVRATDAGALVGRLEVDDPDTAAAGLTWTVAGPEAARFAVDAGGTLRLRDGVDLRGEAGNVLPLVVVVSDGTHAPALLVEVAVLPGDAPAQAQAPAPPAAGPAVLGPGQAVTGFRLEAGTAAAAVASWRLAAVATGADGVTAVTLGDGQVVRLPAVERLVLADGTLDFRAGAPAAVVSRLYEGLLGRAPDAAGLGWWTALAERAGGGAGAREVAAGLVGSVEFAVRFGTLADAPLVASLYRALLGREADGAGLGHHLRRLEEGASRAEVALGFARSDEAAARHAAAHPGGLWVPDPDAAFVHAAYDAVLDRAPGAAELRYWLRVLDGSGADHAVLARRLCDDVELEARLDGLDASGIVGSLYATALGRAPVGAETAHWVAALEAGQPFWAVALGFAESAEALSPYRSRPFGDAFALA